MFTGIITGVGRIVDVHDLGRSLQHGKRLSLSVPDGYLADVGLGDSIAINGACMTVTVLKPQDNRFCIDISAESLDKTSGLDGLGEVNLEKALRANDRLGGQGSITVNGVSLTVNRVLDHADGTEISINLIPHTVQNTALHRLKAGSKVNLEIDLIARYVERMLRADPSLAPPHP